MGRYEIKLVGVGGQGIRTSGSILGLAATIDGKNATHWQSYGAETRGGPSVSEIVTSDEKIDYPRVIAADLLVALDQGMLNEHLGDLKPGGILVVDLDLVMDTPRRPDIVTKRVPMSRVADRLGQRLTVNMVMLGVLAATTRILSRGALVKAIAANVPEHTRQVNTEAFEAGVRLAEEVMAESHSR